MNQLILTELKKRFQEPSTYYGLATAAAGVLVNFGYLNGDQAASLLTFIGALGFLPDKQHSS